MILCYVKPSKLVHWVSVLSFPRAKKREAEVTKFLMVVYRALVSVLLKEHTFDWKLLLVKSI